MIFYPPYWPYRNPPYYDQPPTDTWHITTRPATSPDYRVDELFKRVEELIDAVDILTERVCYMEQKKPSPDDPVDNCVENVFLLNDRIEKLTRRISDLENGVRF